MFENNKRGVALAQVDLVGVVFQRISCCAIKSCLLPCSLSSTTYHKQQPSVGYQLLLRPQGRRHDFWYMFEINKRGNVALAQVDLVGVVFQRCCFSTVLFFNVFRAAPSNRVFCLVALAHEVTRSRGMRYDIYLKRSC